MHTTHALNSASNRMWRCVEDVQSAIENMWIARTVGQHKEAVMWGMTACGILNGRWNSFYSTFFE